MEEWHDIYCKRSFDFSVKKFRIISFVHVLKISLENSEKRCLKLWRMQRVSWFSRWIFRSIHSACEKKPWNYSRRKRPNTRRGADIVESEQNVKIHQEVEQVQLRDILWNKIILVARLCILCIFNIFNVCFGTIGESRFWNIIWHSVGSGNKSFWHAMCSETKTFNTMQIALHER